MKKIILLPGIIFNFMLVHSQPSFTWAGKMGSTAYDEALCTKMDASGNVYSTGYFRNTADFDPGAGTYTLTSAGEHDIFVSKLDASGNFAWAVRFGSTDVDQGYSVAVDASGNVYSTGYFSGTVDFDPGAGIYNLTSSVGYSIFISKLDASGNFVWAKLFDGASGSDVGHSITVDGSGNVFTTGSFSNIVDFDPGAGTYTLESEFLFGSTYSRDIFLSKLDASGNFAWALKLGSDGEDYAYSVTLGGSNVYLTGQYQNTVDFDPGAGTSNLTAVAGHDIFVCKLDASGSFVWAKSMGGTGYDWSNSIAVDASGNVLTTGFFDGTADFDPGAGTFNIISNSFSYDIFISKLDASGNFVWAKSMGSSGSDEGHSIAVDASGYIYTTGYFYYTVDFDPGAGTSNLASSGAQDIFVSKLDASGNYVWAGKMGGTSTDVGNTISLTSGGSICIGGYFTLTADFDPGAGTYNLSSTGGYDLFAVKLGSSVLPVNLLSFEGVNLSNCNWLTWKTASEINNDYFTIEKSEDGILWKEIARKEAAGNSNTITTYNYRDYDLKAGAGIVYYRLKQTDIDGRYNYSGIIAIHFVTSDDVRIIVFPNPATANSISLLIEGMKGEQAIIKLSDLSGKQLYSKLIFVDSRYYYSLNIYKDLNLSSGIYILSVKNKNKFITQKLMVQ